MAAPERDHTPRHEAADAAARARRAPARSRQVSAGLLLLACLLILASIWLPWVTISVSPVPGVFYNPVVRAGSVRAIDAPVIGAPTVFFVIGAGLVLPLLAFAAAGLSAWRSDRPDIPRYPVATGAFIGGVCTLAFAYLLTLKQMPFACFRCVPHTVWLDVGFWLAIAGYLVGLVGGFVIAIARGRGRS